MKQSPERKYLRELTTKILLVICALDSLAERPDLKEIFRAPIGSALARFNNALELANDGAMHFGLGISLAAIAKRKKTITQGLSNQVHAGRDRPRKGA